MTRHDRQFIGRVAVLLFLLAGFAWQFYEGWYAATGPSVGTSSSAAGSLASLPLLLIPPGLFVAGLILELSSAPRRGSWGLLAVLSAAASAYFLAAAVTGATTNLNLTYYILLAVLALISIPRAFSAGKMGWSRNTRRGTAEPRRPPARPAPGPPAHPRPLSERTATPSARPDPSATLSPRTAADDEEVGDAQTDRSRRRGGPDPRGGRPSPGSVLAACGSSSARATTTQAAATGAPGDGQAPDMSALFTQALDPLVEDGTITSDQESAVIDALASSMPGRGQGQGGQCPARARRPRRPDAERRRDASGRCAGLDARPEPDVLDRARRRW